MKDDLSVNIPLPKGVTARLEKNVLYLRGPKGEVARAYSSPGVGFQVQPEAILLEAKKATKREKRMMNTFAAHIKNSVAGVQEPYVYTLKICSGHFPMQVSMSGREFIIKNFLGETTPRKATLPEGTEVKIAGTEITVKSPDKELAGQTAARIELLCRITKRDIRIFQDGCHMTSKAGRKLN